MMSACRQTATGQPRRKHFRLCTVFLTILGLINGCGFSTRIPSSTPTGLEQLLVSTALERAVHDLELHRYAGKRVHVDLFSQLEDDYFIQEFIETVPSYLLKPA